MGDRRIDVATLVLFAVAAIAVFTVNLLALSIIEKLAFICLNTFVIGMFYERYNPCTSELKRKTTKRLIDPWLPIQPLVILAGRLVFGMLWVGDSNIWWLLEVPFLFITVCMVVFWSAGRVLIRYLALRLENQELEAQQPTPRKGLGSLFAGIRPQPQDDNEEAAD